MCELFQQKFLDQIFDRIKKDTFALDILRDKLGMEIIECPYNLIGCEKYYVELSDGKSLTRKGSKCSRCDTRMCKSCKKFKMASELCLNCHVKTKAKRELYEVSCPMCQGNVSAIREIAGYFCINCKIFVLKKDLAKKNPKEFSIMYSGPNLEEFLQSKSSESESESE